MKYYIIIFFAFFMSSCCTAKQVVQKPEKDTAQLEEVVSVAEIPEEHESIVEETHPEMVEIVEIPISPKSVDTVEDLVIGEAFDHNPWNDLLQRHVSNEGNVNYEGFLNDRYVLQHYIKSLDENMPDVSWNRTDKLAYWMNAYNALTVDLILQNYPIKSIKDIKDPWGQRLWKLGTKWYNLEEIEHEILRKMNEPRIHFGIVCASFSCPKLQNEAFTSSQLEEQLTNATKEFLADPNRNNITSNNIKISKIFQWFSKDFEQKGSLIDFLNQYSDVQISSKAKKSYKDYNWDLNE